MSVAYGKGPKAKATRLHSKLVRSRGKCESCGDDQYEHLQCAHIISRRYSTTRCDENAAFCLCWKCHRRYTDHPDEWMSFVEKKIGLDEYLRLKHKAIEGSRSRVKVDWDAEVLRLQALLKEVA